MVDCWHGLGGQRACFHAESPRDFRSPYPRKNILSIEGVPQRFTGQITGIVLLSRLSHMLSYAVEFRMMRWGPIETYNVHSVHGIEAVIIFPPGWNKRSHSQNKA